MANHGRKAGMHSKSQVKWSGPLERFAVGFDAELARLGYTPAGTRRKLEAAAHLSQWLAGRGMTVDDIGDDTGPRASPACPQPPGTRTKDLQTPA